MARRITALPPDEWRELPESKRLDLLVKLFIMRCTTKVLFQNGRLCADYHKIRNYFRSRPDEETNVIYDYISTLTDKKIMSWQEVYNVAEINRKRLAFEIEKKKIDKMRESGKIKEYKDISIGDVLNL